MREYEISMSSPYHEHLLNNKQTLNYATEESRIGLLDEKEILYQQF